MRCRWDYFSVCVLKPHKLTRFIKVISSINGSYQQIFKQAPYEGYSPLTYTGFIGRIGQDTI